MPDGSGLAGFEHAKGKLSMEEWGNIAATAAEKTEEVSSKEEIDPNTLESLERIADSATRNYLSKIYTQRGKTADYHIPLDAVATSEPYQELSEFYQVKAEAEAAIEADKTLTAEQVEQLQTAYDATKVRHEGVAINAAWDQAAEADASPTHTETAPKDPELDQSETTESETENVLADNPPAAVAQAKQRVFAEVDAVSGYTHTERAAVHELLTTIETAATVAEQAAAAERLSNYLSQLQATAKTSETPAEAESASDSTTETARENEDVPLAVLVERKEQLQKRRTLEPQGLDPEDGNIPIKMGSHEWQAQAVETRHDMLRDEEITTNADAERRERENLIALHGLEVGQDIYDSRQITRRLRREQVATDSVESESAAEEMSNEFVSEPDATDTESADATVTAAPDEAITPVGETGSSTTTERLTEILDSVDQTQLESEPPRSQVVPPAGPIHSMDVHRPKNPESQSRPSRAERISADKLQNAIIEIEQQKLGFMDKIFKDLASPAELFGDEPFAKFADIVQLSKPEFNEFQAYVAREYGGAQLNYQTLKAWENRLGKLQQIADRMPVNERTTTAVISAYISNFEQS